MKKTTVKKFDTIARRYIALRTKEPDRHIDFCVQQSSLASAIDVAARAIDDRNKIHMHQRRMGKTKLKHFAQKLKLKEPEIMEACDFDQLLKIVESIKITGISELTYYDTSTRIGAYRGLFPNKIYLHAGTRTGAKNVFGRIYGRKFIYVNELPNEFRVHGFTASEFEDILCVFKDDLEQLYLNRTIKLAKPQ